MALKGTNGDDSFSGTIFDDEIFGFGGNDIISGSPGSDRIDGGADIDKVDYSHFLRGTLFIEGDAVDVDLERGTQFGGLAEGDVLIDVENILGSVENDTIRGDAEGNVLSGFSGDDILEGRGGDDVLEGDDGNDILLGDTGGDLLDGGAGIDTANYGASNAAVSVFLTPGTGSGGTAAGDFLVEVENLTGSNFADTLVGSAVANVLAGGLGNDTLAGLAGGDTLNGGGGFDIATYAASGSGVTVDLTLGDGSGGDATNDTLTAIENLIGSNFLDSLVGNSLANVLDGGGSVDLLAGRLGNDIYIVDNAGDAVIENAGEGVDEVRASASYTLSSGAEVETLRTTDENGTAAINLTGNNLVNTIVGNNGNNTISGGGGGDTLIGARGVDALSGGSGADRFVWRDVTDSGTAIPAMDLIVDFDPLAGELIDLSGIDANAIAAGNQAFTFIGAAGFSGTPGEVNFVQVNGETIIQMQTGVENDIEMGVRIQGIVTPETSWFVL
jgi:Ca2+-binding RTX toxin-like protein